MIIHAMYILYVVACNYILLFDSVCVCVCVCVCNIFCTFTVAIESNKKYVKQYNRQY